MRQGGRSNGEEQVRPSLVTLVGSKGEGAGCANISLSPSLFLRACVHSPQCMSAVFRSHLPFGSKLLLLSLLSLFLQHLLLLLLFLRGCPRQRRKILSERMDPRRDGVLVCSASLPYPTKIPAIPDYFDGGGP